MKRAHWSRISLFSVGLLAVVPVKCNSILERRKPEDDAGEYEYVTMTGSNMPQKVKKGTRLVPVSNTEVATGDSLRDALQRNQRSPRSGN